MHRNPIAGRSLLLAGLVLTMATACDDGPTDPARDRLTATEAELLAVEIDRMSGDIVDGRMTQLGMTGLQDEGPGEIGALATRTVEVTFEVDRTCPAGGSVHVQGEMVRQWDAETSTLTVHTEATRTMSSCAHEGDRGTLTVDGALSITADRMRVEGKPSGPQTMTHQGTITWTRDSGESRTCEIEITSVLDPEAKTRTVTGTICDRTFSKTVTWSVSS